MYAQFILTPIIIFILIAFILLLFIIYRRRKKYSDREIELLRLNQEKEILSAKIEIQEELHQRISMDIHDNVGQSLLLANINLSILQNIKILNSDQLQIMLETKKLITQASEDITEHTRSMNPDRIYLIGVFEAMRIELENLKRKNLYNIKIHFYQEIEKSINIKNNIQIMIFRVFQEGLKNIIKYANATQITLTVNQNKNSLIITIQDNGIGFKIKDQNLTNGIGLNNMKKRIDSIGGQLEILSSPGQGTTLIIKIAINNLQTG